MKCPLVLIDLETIDCEVLEIGAVYKNLTFRRYILPKGPISPSASAVNYLTSDGDRLFYKSEPVETVPLREALIEFLSFLKKVSEKMNDSEIILGAHNGHHFDFKHLFRVIKEEGLKNKALPIIYGCLDTLLWLKDLYPGLKSYTQRNLVSRILNTEYNAHSALDDAETLQKLLIKIFSDLNVDAAQEKAVKHIRPASLYC